MYGYSEQHNEMSRHTCVYDWNGFVKWGLVLAHIEFFSFVECSSACGHYRVLFMT